MKIRNDEKQKRGEPLEGTWCWDANGSNNRYNCGGSWNNNADNCKVSSWNNNNANNRNNNIGFRLVRSPASVCLQIFSFAVLCR